MYKAFHSSRISLGTLEDHLHTFEIPIWNLKTEVQNSSEMVGFIKTDSWPAALL